MRISEDNEACLKLSDRTVWISLVSFAAAAFMLTTLVTTRGPLGLLVPSGFLILFGLAFLHATDVTFDKAARTCDIRRLDVVRRSQTRLDFNDITDIKVEIGPTGRGLPVANCRLSVVTKSADVPLTASFEPGIERYDAMRNAILDVVMAGASRPPAADPVDSLVKAGRSIDAVAVLRGREGLSLTAARERVAELERENS
jgi:hypothetical protein